MTDFFKGLSQVKYEGPNSSNPLAYRHYNKDEMVLGKRMEDHIRPAIAYWHTFAWEGGDPFGGVRDHPARDLPARRAGLLLSHGARLPGRGTGGGAGRMSLLKVEGLVVGYGPHPVLHGIDFEVREGEVCVLLHADTLLPAGAPLPTCR